ncbi:hypothetical protein ACFYNL_17365 [Streptomyces sp. NPDC007808]|uniref:hypothetical protein n=1 Tax=Streptomyces sp. NPDC007808 TaxID=3364779 RepID=UPI003677D810
MSENDVRLFAADPAWWKAPFAATLLGLPLLAWEYGVYGADGYAGALEALLYGGLVLLVVAWALPHRRSARMLRTTAACAGVVCAVLPLLLLMLMAMAMAAG